MKPAAAELIGVTAEPFEFVVELGKVREFARATLAEHPSYTDDPAPWMPPTFIAAAAQWAPFEEQLLDRAGRDRKRALHGEQEFTFPGPPPRAGVRLVGRPRIEDVFEREGRRGGALRFIVIMTEFEDDTGAVVATSRTTVVETERAPAAA